MSLQHVAQASFPPPGAFCLFPPKISRFIFGGVIEPPPRSQCVVTSLFSCEVVFLSDCFQGEYERGQISRHYNISVIFLDISGAVKRGGGIFGGLVFSWPCPALHTAPCQRLLDGLSPPPHQTSLLGALSASAYLSLVGIQSWMAILSDNATRF